MTALPLARTAAASSASDRSHGGLYMLAVLSLLMGFASISTDIYLPAMPAMARSLATDAGTMEFTLSSYLAGFAIGQLAWGPIGDRFGRRWPTVIGLALFTVGAAGCALSGTALELIGWRIVQALGASAAVVLSRAMVRDLYSGDRAAQMLSTLISVMALAPLLGPIVGGQILLLASWQAIFWSLVGIDLLTIALTLSLRETLASERRSHEGAGHVVLRYTRLLRDPAIMAYALTGAFYYAGMFAYVAGSPFAFVDYFGVSPQLYGWLFAAGVIGIMGGNLLNARLVTRFGYRRMLRAGSTGGTLAAALAVAVTLSGVGGLWGLLVALVLFTSMTGFIVANSIAGAMEQEPERAGAVSALVGSIQYGSGIVGSGLVGLFADGTPLPMALIILACAIGAWACGRLVPVVAR